MVEGGFFNLLDVSFSDGLNVLVGGRGVGKTSIIELIRFALGIPNLSDSASRDSSMHAMSILQLSGRVSVEADINGQTVTISRSANEAALPLPLINKPIIFSQTEIESISLNSSGKLNLIDSFGINIDPERKRINSIKREIESLHSEFIVLRKEYDDAHELAAEKQKLKTKEHELLQQQEMFSDNNQNLNEYQKNYTDIQKQLDVINLEINNLGYILNIFESREKELTNIKPFNKIVVNNAYDTSPFFEKVNNFINIQNEKIEQIIQSNKDILNEVQLNLSKLHEQKTPMEETARYYRNEIGKVTEQAGSLLVQLHHIKSEIVTSTGWENVAANKYDQMLITYNKIQDSLKELTSLRKGIYLKREEIVNNLNASLNPMVKVDLTYSTDTSSYMDSIKSTLKGSGLKYNEIVNEISNKINPQFLFYYCFTEKYNEFAELLSIPLDRATRLLGYLKDMDIGEILTAEINDELNFFLFDKGSYKRVEELSIGQRCTVALSIILENKNRGLIIDQPEDHLDNEFIANTLIKSLDVRSAHAQTILSSHNANIPVLGNADRVINLESNGRRGFVKHQGSIFENEIKQAIESIMEGGRSAFQHRAMFYSGD
ncbi:AAA family ATPase [Pantoea sp. S61]|nr:AAA family ATPase [Pantoea sp. S61]MBK0127596.1 AAA family ATPase [Pantoea sp. S61]